MEHVSDDATFLRIFFDLCLVGSVNSNPRSTVYINSYFIGDAVTWFVHMYSCNPGKICERAPARQMPRGAGGGSINFFLCMLKNLFHCCNKHILLL